MRRAVFFDRDGTLNRAVVRDGLPYPPASAAEVQIVPDAPSGLARLKEAGFLLVVVTNQPDVARGRQSRTEAEAIQAAVREALPLLDDLFACYHDDADGCNCRKPKPGMLLEAAAKHSINLSRSFVVGDSWRDVDAGAAAGCKTILIDCDYRDRLPEHPPDTLAGSLGAAVYWILHESLAVSP